MIIELSDTERAACMVAWRTGKLDTSKIEALDSFEPARRLTPEECAKIWAHLDKYAEMPGKHSAIFDEPEKER